MPSMFVLRIEFAILSSTEVVFWYSTEPLVMLHDT